MADHSDPDSSPKASSSSDSNSGGEEEKPIGAIRTPAQTGEDPSAYADPESPSTGQQSSDESGSSDGVLVELPANPDQVGCLFFWLKVGLLSVQIWFCC